MKKYALLLVDCQNDFVDPLGEIFIKGSDQLVIRLAKWLEYYSNNIMTVYCTADSHSTKHISFYNYWCKGPNGTVTPQPGNLISLSDVNNGVISTSNPKNLNWAKEYLSKIVGQSMTLWPTHCINGSWGSSLPKYLTDVFIKKNMDFRLIRKGEYAESEMYGAFDLMYPVLLPGLDVPESKSILRNIVKYDKIIVGGVGVDMTISNSLETMIKYHQKDIKNKLILLKDGLMPINNNVTTPVIDYCLKSLGAIICNTTDIKWE